VLCVSPFFYENILQGKKRGKKRMIEFIIGMIVGGIIGVLLRGDLKIDIS